MPAATTARPADTLFSCFALASVLTTLNAVDALLTLIAVQAGAAERNPLMGALLAWHPLAFLLVKLLAVGAGVAWLVRHRVEWALWCGVAVYAVVDLQHAVGLFFVGL